MNYKTFIFTLCLLANASAQAGVINIGTTDDRTIGDTNGDQIGDSLLTQNDGFLRTGFFSTHWRSALEFDLAGIDSNSVIDSANFFVRDQGSSRDGVLNIWGYSGDGIVNMNDGGMTANLIGSINIDASAGAQDFNIDVAAFIQNLYDNNASYAGFLIGANTPTGLGGAASDMCSGDVINYCNNSNYPTLTVNFSAVQVSGPASVALFGLGLAGIGFSRKKKTT